MKLQLLLSTKVLANGKTAHCSDFVKALKVDKDNIFHASDVPKDEMGPIHALVLQLIAKGIVALGISDSTKMGTAKLKDNDVMLYLPNGMNDQFILGGIKLDLTITNYLHRISTTLDTVLCEN